MTSPEQLPTEIRDALKSFLEDDLQHAEGDTGPLFGHIAMPRWRLPGVPQAIYDLLPVDRADTSFIFVNFDETETLAAKDDGVPIESLSFYKFMSILRKNIRPERGSFPWWEPVDIDDWLEEKILPAKSVVVMQLSPQMSADRVLALTCVVEWACAEFPIERDIRVVTVSSPIGQDILFDLVSQHQDNPSVPVCDIESLWKPSPKKDCHIYDTHALEEIIEELKNVIRDPTENARLILSFDENIDAYLFSRWTVDGTEACQRFHIYAGDVPFSSTCDVTVESSLTPTRALVVPTTASNHSHSLRSFTWVSCT
ncbi:uncharacterized protein B0J16DRAFT_386956 [Fusarium flagelliforme]|uniref:uncharacterized protein n=1 Tax=Fusarium flagelliforme TaxID=2675880 RepID=UPI001E8EB306|nr:uncharacterized protein B0J16DRAFT_386956 [Fusarium flagelliforme]KAH7179132.1 hypothetical protein B0J16DRAFT_386956 [Fusarium flagelliforme]